MKVLWTRRALTRLAEIEDYIALDSAMRAAGFISELMDRADSLSDFPEAGRFVPEDEEGLRREIIHEGYRIIYRIDSERILILSVFEGSRMLRSDDLK